MTQRCKCEHWQECPTCAPQRFDADGKRKPPEPTPLQACRAELETMREALALHEVGSAYAHRLAVMLECALLDPTGTWNEAHALLDEYRAACRAAAMDRLGDFGAKLIVDTKEDEASYFINVIVFEQLTGEVRQWVTKDGHMDFWMAVNRMAHIGTMPLGDFVGVLTRDMTQIV